jgi:hypothetical protein
MSSPRTVKKCDSRNVEVRPARYRSFEVTTGSAMVAHYSGIDLTPEMVYRFREDAYKEQHKRTGIQPQEWGDETVWEGDDLLAVIQSALAANDDPIDGPWQTVYLFEWNGEREPGEKFYASEDSKSVARGREVRRAEYEALEPDDEDEDEDEDDDEPEDGD